VRSHSKPCPKNSALYCPQVLGCLLSSQRTMCCFDDHTRSDSVGPGGRALRAIGNLCHGHQGDTVITAMGNNLAAILVACAKHNKLEGEQAEAFAWQHFVGIHRAYQARRPTKKKGRPATGQDPVTAIRLSAELRNNVDALAGKQIDKPRRSEAIRRLVELGLKAKP
jgi:hypothetical protein